MTPGADSPFGALKEIDAGLDQYRDFRGSVALLQRQEHHHPVPVSAFPDELYQAPRSWAERA